MEFHKSYHDVVNNNSFPCGKLLSGMIAIKLLSVEYGYAVWFPVGVVEIHLYATAGGRKEIAF